MDSSGSRQVDGRRLATTVSLKLVRYALILVERVHTRPFYRRDMDERIIAATFRRNEAITLVCVEKFNGSGDHMDILVPRSEEHTSELQSLMRISYAVFCLKKKTKIYTIH